MAYNMDMNEFEFRPDGTTDAGNEEEEAAIERLKIDVTTFGRLLLI